MGPDSRHVDGRWLSESTEKIFIRGRRRSGGAVVHPVAPDYRNAGSGAARIVAETRGGGVETDYWRRTSRPKISAPNFFGRALVLGRESIIEKPSAARWRKLFNDTDIACDRGRPGKFESVSGERNADSRAQLEIDASLRHHRRARKDGRQGDGSRRPVSSYRDRRTASWSGFHCRKQTGK